MTSEQEWVDQVDAALLALEARVPVMQRLRSIPLDLIAVAVMKQLAKDGASQPFTPASLEHALTEIGHRNR
jgi:hypothetical protein